MSRLHGYYRLTKATAAVERRDKRKCYQVPDGAVILINGLCHEGALVEVIYDGRSLLMFEDDLVSRTHSLEAQISPDGAAHFLRPSDDKQTRNEFPPSQPKAFWAAF